MKYLLASLFLFSSAVFGQTVINFDDGSTYTLEEGQEIYISTARNTLFTRKVMNNKDTHFYAEEPWSKRDYVAQPQDDFSIGSHEWCKAYIPWSEGLTFDMVWWQRACDTNGDGEYNELDAGWDE